MGRDPRHSGDFCWETAHFFKITQKETKKYFGGLKIIGAASANCNQGFDILPAPMRGDGRMFVRAKTKTGKTGVSCSFDFINLGKEKTCQVK